MDALDAIGERNAPEGNAHQLKLSMKKPWTGPVRGRRVCHSAVATSTPRAFRYLRVSFGMGMKRLLFVEPGQVYGRLVVLEEGKFPNGKRAVRVRCTGPHEPLEKLVHLAPLVRGTIQSCGCLQRERASVVTSDSPDAARRREWRKRRNSPDYQPKRILLVDEGGRECSYSGRGNCRHAYKPWSEFSHNETRCKPCMVAKQREYMEDEPDEVRLRRAERQRAYAKTSAGREVNRRARLAYRYGITETQYRALWEQQGGRCYFCGFEERVTHHATGKVMQLAVDHDHECGQGHDHRKACAHCVRGLACYNCNIFIARAERSPVLRPRLDDLLTRRPLLDISLT